MNTTQQNEVALFIDFENIHTSIRTGNIAASYVDWRMLLDTLETFGRIAIRRAYTDWAEMAKYQNTLARFGIETQNAFGRGKNVSDIFMAVEAMETLCTRPEVDTYILVTGDGDFSVLVHRLRNHHKNVIGVGVRGASSQGLIEACDDFIFYDDLLKEHRKKASPPPPPEPKSRPKPRRKPKPEKPPAQSKPGETRLERLSRNLKEALPADGSWINGATLIYQIRELNSQFDKEMQKEGFDRFRAFLEGRNEIVELRSAPGKGHMEARLSGVVNDDKAYDPQDLPPEKLEYSAEDYLDVLEQLRPRVTPNPLRPNAILKMHQIMVDQGPKTLNQLKAVALEEMRGTYEKGFIEEILHQLYHTYSFEFDRSSDAPQWDRPCRFQDHIERGVDLLDNCDLGLLRRLRRGIPDEVDLKPEIVAYILYGAVDDDRVLERAETILEWLKEEEDQS